MELKKWRCKGRKKTKKGLLPRRHGEVVGPFFLKNRKDTAPTLVKWWRVVKQEATPLHGDSLVMALSEYLPHNRLGYKDIGLAG